jgi:DNA-binding CsgD family transcriptional regulator
MLLTNRELRRCLELVYLLNGAADDPGLPAELLAGMRAVLGCDSVAYARVDVASRGLVGAVAHPVDANLVGSAAFLAAIHQHPGFAAHRAGRLAPDTSVAMSDLVPLRSLRRLPLYVDFYQPRGIRDQLLTVLRQSDGQGTVLTVNRSGRGFTARERAIVDLLAPHVRQALAHRERLAALTVAARRASQRIAAAEHAAALLPNLTPRERGIAGLLADGLTNREIARALVISERTVHKHLEQIYRKLGAGNRTSVAALLHRAAG